MTDRILEIGGYSAGFCGRLFAQNGHEVTRVEKCASTCLGESAGDVVVFAWRQAPSAGEARAID